MPASKTLTSILHVLYLVFLASIICSLRAVSSISIALILIVGCIHHRQQTGRLFHYEAKSLFMICMALLFLINVLALLYTTNTHEGWNSIRLATGLVITPLALYGSGNFIPANRDRVLYQYVIIITLASLSCLIIAVIRYLNTGTSIHFYYHALVSPFRQHAVYFSILVFVALLYLVEKLGSSPGIKKLRVYIAFTVFLSAILFLLSSRLVLVCYLVYLFSVIFILLRERTGRYYAMIAAIMAVILFVAVILFTRNPVSSRFKEIYEGDLALVMQEKFDPGNYFNGLQFRLLQWRFAGEILSEKQDWITGVGPGDSQTLLDSHYTRMGLYTGEPGVSSGYLGYNTHNQFLQTLLETGLAGLVVLLGLCFAVIRIAWIRKNRILNFTVLLLLAWLFSEAVFKTQYGIIIFTFFFIFLAIDRERA